MHLRSLFADDDAVSPVIGVILMVAITVIMAAITGAFVLSMQTNTSVAPQTAWDVSAEDTNGQSGLDSVVIRHRAGDRVETDTLSVQVPSGRTNVYGGPFVDVGDRIEVELNDSGTTGPAGDELLLVWRESAGSESVILKRHKFTSEYGTTDINATVT